MRVHCLFSGWALANQLLRGGHGPRSGVRGHRPGPGRRGRRRGAGRRAPAEAGRGDGHPRTPRPHVLGHPALPGERGGVLDPSGRTASCSPTRCGRWAPRPGRCSPSWRPATPGFVEPDEVRELHDGAAGHGGRGRLLARCTRPGTPRARRCSATTTTRTSSRWSSPATSCSPARSGGPTCPGGTSPAMLESLRTKVLPLPDPVVVLPGHGPRTTMAGSGRPTRTSARPSEARGEPAPAAVRLPRADAGGPDRRAGGARPAAADLRAARVRLHRDPGGRAAGPAGQAGRDRQGGVRGLSGCTPSPGPAPSSACTSTSPCRWPATCWRTPTRWPSRSVATRSRRCGAVSGPRRAATGSSPRPTSTSSTSTRWPRTTTSSCRWSPWRRWSGCTSTSACRRC